MRIASRVVNPLDGIAAELASELVDGEPRKVCGATSRSQSASS